MGGEKAVHRRHRRGQRQLGGLARDQIEVGGFLRALGEHLDEAGIVGAVVIVVSAMHIERGLGNRAATQVEHVRQALANSGVQRFVHESHALGGGEIHGTQTGHRHAGSHPSGGVLRFRLDENQRPSSLIDVPVGNRLRPVFAHLRRRRDRVGAGGIGRLTLDVNDGGIAVHRVAYAGILGLVGGNSGASLRHEAVGEDLLDHRECHGHFLGFRVQVCNGSGSLRRIFFAAAPFTARSGVSNQTMAPVGQRSMGSRVAWSFQS